ncbi:hypothetical protein [Peribacillus simplex]|uniref:hypothetical protein n=1 Tax=Peribacillus simplex TaxID=1478 RepID=UPI003D2C593E
MNINVYQKMYDHQGKIHFPMDFFWTPVPFCHENVTIREAYQVFLGVFLAIPSAYFRKRKKTAF